MILKNDELMHEFYANESDKYPDINLEQMKDIVFNPWVFLRKEMESGELDTVRLKYFGTFQVYKGRAEHMLVNLKERFRFNKVDPEQYKKLKPMLEKFINKNV